MSDERENYIGRPYAVALEHNSAVDVSLPSSMSGSYEGWQDLATKALVRIAEHEYENKTLNLFLKDLANRLEVASYDRDHEKARADRLEAEVARLREALKDVIEGWDWWRKDEYDRDQSVV